MTPSWLIRTERRTRHQPKRNFFAAKKHASILQQQGRGQVRHFDLWIFSSSHIPPNDSAWRSEKVSTVPPFQGPSCGMRLLYGTHFLHFCLDEIMSYHIPFFGSVRFSMPAQFVQVFPVCGRKLASHLASGLNSHSSRSTSLVYF